MAIWESWSPLPCSTAGAGGSHLHRGIFVGADVMSRSAGVPNYIAQVMVATALLTMVTAIMLARYRIRWR